MNSQTLTNILQFCENEFESLLEVGKSYPFSSEHFLNSLSLSISNCIPNLARFIVAVFSNKTKRNLLRNVIDILLEALPYFRLKCFFISQKSLDEKQRIDLQNLLNSKLQQVDQAANSKVMNGSTKSQIDISAYYLLYYPNTLSAIFHKFELFDGIFKVEKIEDTLNLNSKFNLHQGPHKIQAAPGFRIIDRCLRGQEKKLQGDLAELNQLCKHFSLNSKIFIDKWNLSHKDERDNRDPPNVWLQGEMICYFECNDSINVSNLSKFGFLQNICNEMNEWLENYSHHHPCSLLASWFDAHLISLPQFKCPLSDLFQEVMTIQSNQIKSSNEISSGQTDFPVLFYKKDPSDDNHVWLENLKQRFKSDDDDAFWLYHGTSSYNADSILQDGIQIKGTERKNDFGPGFYTTPDFNEAHFYAQKIRTSPSIEEDSMNHVPTILAYKVNTINWVSPTPKMTSSTLKDKMIHLRLYDDEEYKKVIKHYKGAGANKVHTLFKIGRDKLPTDIVEGQISKRTNESFLQSDITQYCFRTEKVCQHITLELKFIIILPQPV